MGGEWEEDVQDAGDGVRKDRCNEDMAMRDEDKKHFW